MKLALIIAFILSVLLIFLGIGLLIIFGPIASLVSIPFILSGIAFIALGVEAWKL
jgi:hypothetical protein